MERRESILLDYLPETVKVNGEEYPICSDFRACILFEKILHDTELTSQEIVTTAVDLFYEDERPADLKDALDGIVYFYSCGTPKKTETKGGKKVDNINQPRIYDFDYDADYIFAAFLTQYGIDLNEIEYMHWWKFQALFKSLESHNKIVEIMGYRATDLGKIKDKHERARIAKLKTLYAIPDNLSVEDKVALAGAAFGGMI